jgi:glycolate oxidase FAD binding subunit
MPAAAPGCSAFEWNGLQRWTVGDDAGQSATQQGAERGSTTLFRAARGAGTVEREVFAPLPGSLLSLHRAVKATFDPAGIFNPGRMYRTL